MAPTPWGILEIAPRMLSRRPFLGTSDVAVPTAAPCTRHPLSRAAIQDGDLNGANAVRGQHNNGLLARTRYVHAAQSFLDPTARRHPSMRGVLTSSCLDLSWIVRFGRGKQRSLLGLSKCVPLARDLRSRCMTGEIAITSNLEV